METCIALPADQCVPRNTKRHCGAILAGRSFTNKDRYPFDRIADVSIPILILGETGVGKEVVARRIHEISKRRKFPFLKINCPAIPTDLLESELFGHEKGSFTGAHQTTGGKFAAADGGTIFLDEIGEMHPRLQAKLLQVLQDGEAPRVGRSMPIKFNARIIAATNRDLEKEIQEGSFREDLFYRINVVTVTIPPLRQRPEDIPDITAFLLRQCAQELDCPVPAIAPETIRLFEEYSWPGNVRELENILKKAMVFHPGQELRPEFFSLKPRLPRVPIASSEQELVHIKQTSPTGLRGVSRAAQMEAERRAILEALEKTRWNRTKAAILLQISYKALLNKIVQYRLNKNDS